MGTWEDIEPITDFMQVFMQDFNGTHAPGAISVHGSFWPGEPRTQALQSGAEDSTNWATPGTLVGETMRF